VLILLPPSESKHARTRGKPTDLDSLSHPELTGPRREVAAALAGVSARPDAAKVLGVGAAVAEEIERNTRLASAPAVPVSQLYTGVLYDALDLAGMDTAARRRASRAVFVSSALYGVLRLPDRVAPYRLSMGVTVPGVGALAGFWRPHLAEALSHVTGLVVDCRSGSYAAAWKPPATAQWVQVRVPGASHWAKHTRGLVAGALCRLSTAPSTPDQLADALAGQFAVLLHPPTRPSQPWVLDVTPPTT